MDYDTFIVRPIDRETADSLCQDHSHAESLPNSSQHHMRLEIDGKVAGLAAWGYGIRPAHTPGHLFGDAGEVDDYFELTRFFVYDWVPKNTASKFLSITHRMLEKYTNAKWLYTYAAGFQGVIGTIYQASNYDYIGTTKAGEFLYVPEFPGHDDGVLMHPIALWHRWHEHGGGITHDKLAALSKKFDQECYMWAGRNFRYIYWLCDDDERDRLLSHANFEVQDENPSMSDLEIWIEDVDGNTTPISPERAKQVPLIKVPSSDRNR